MSFSAFTFGAAVALSCLATAAMSIRPISRSDFDSFKVPPCFRGHLAIYESAWFADSTGKTLGVIYLDPASGFWACDACERQRNGRYRRITLAVDLKNADAAEVRLITAMERQIAQQNAEVIDRRNSLRGDATEADKSS